MLNEEFGMEESSFKPRALRFIATLAMIGGPQISQIKNSFGPIHALSLCFVLIILEFSRIIYLFTRYVLFRH